MTSFVQIDKTGTIKEMTKKKLTKETLYKCSGFKKPDGFEKRTTWNVSVEGNQHMIELWARDFGKAGTENKYDFPPPCDTSLYFGTCSLIKVSKDDNDEIKDFAGDTWLKIYEKLFGGFEDLSSTANEDENEKDELANVPEKYKTQTGYLKDGFVVDDSELISETGGTSLSDEESFSDEDSNHFIMEDDLELEAIGSELSEDEYIE